MDHPTERSELDRLTELIIGSAIEVHREIGPGLLESAYDECICFELATNGLRFKRQVSLPVRYKGVRIDCGYRMDLVVEEAVVIEIKTVEQLMPIHKAQLLSYLRLGDKRLGLLLNFHVPVLKNGIKRIVNRY